MSNRLRLAAESLENAEAALREAVGTESSLAATLYLHNFESITGVAAAVSEFLLAIDASLQSLMTALGDSADTLNQLAHEATQTDFYIANSIRTGVDTEWSATMRPA